MISEKQLKSKWSKVTQRISLVLHNEVNLSTETCTDPPPSEDAVYHNAIHGHDTNAISVDILQDYIAVQNNQPDGYVTEFSVS